MLRAPVIFAASVALAPVAAQAETDAIRIAPPPGWAQISQPLPLPEESRGVVFIRRNDTEIHLEKDGQKAFTASLVSLLQPNALQLGNVSLSWNPAAGSPVVHAVKVHRNGAVRDVLASAKFEVLRREDQLEAAVLNGILTAVLRVPDLRVGDELELSYTLPQQDPTLGKDSFGLMFLADSPPPGRYGFRLSWVEGQEPVIRPTADMQSLLVREKGAAAFATDMPPMLAAPKDAPPRYSWQRIVEFNDFGSWQAVSGRMSPLFTKAQALPSGSAIHQEAAAIAATRASAFDRVAAALKLVQRDVRYVYVGFNGGNYTPASAEETWQRRYGDCKAKTVLLLALLEQLGIPAEAVLASNSGLDDGLDQRLPSPGLFDHVLVRAQIDGQTYWLDGTLPGVFTPQLQPIMPYRWVLPLQDGGAGLERVVWRPATRPDTLQLYEIDARAGFTEPAVVRQTLIKRGVPAILEYNQFSLVTDEQLHNAFKQELEGSSTWNTVDRVTWRFDTKQQASVLQIEGHGPVDWEDYRGGTRSLDLPGGGFNPPDRRQRGSEQDQSVPFYNPPGFSCNVTTVRLPQATKQKEWSFNSSYDHVMFGETYRRSFEKRDGAIRMIRSSRTLQTELDPKSTVGDNERLPKFDNSMARIYYDPGTNDYLAAREIVPATYDIDWLADDSACLAPKRAQD